jgi:phage tail-like protein
MSSLTSFGFGHQSFGHRPFGHDDWAYIVLYETLPEKYLEEDANNGYFYQKFIKAVSSSFNEMRALIQKYDDLVDPNKIRTDLIKHLADSFGIETDDYNPESYQRTAIRINTRFNVIKGTQKSFEVLAKIYGFNLDITEMWWDGSEYTDEDPWVYNEEIGTVG